MKATGIVRLGRVVIPKEIRRTQRIRRGDPLEIFTTGDGEVIFKKYSPMGELSGVTAQYVDVLSKCFALTAFVSDRDRILAASGAGRRDLADRSVSQPLEKLMDSRKPYQNDGSPEKALLPCEGSPRALLCAVPIIAAGEGGERGGGISGKADGGMIYYIGEPPQGGSFLCGLYDRIMNLSKLF